MGEWRCVVGAAPKRMVHWEPTTIQRSISCSAPAIGWWAKRGSRISTRCAKREANSAPRPRASVCLASRQQVSSDLSAIRLSVSAPPSNSGGAPTSARPPMAHCVRAGSPPARFGVQPAGSGRVARHHRPATAHATSIRAAKVAEPPPRGWRVGPLPQDTDEDPFSLRQDLAVKR